MEYSINSTISNDTKKIDAVEDTLQQALLAEYCA